MSNDKPKLRSQKSYGRKDRDGFIHRSWMRSEGLPDSAFDGRPIVGICNTWSELTPCNGHLRDIAEYVKRGVWEAGGVPLEFPAMSLGETQMRPTAMLFRNLLAMEVEEFEPRQSDRRGRPAGRLRQDHARPVDGCGQRESADYHCFVGADAEWKIQGQGYRLRNRCVEIQRGGSRRRNAAQGLYGGRVGHVAEPGNLHDDGKRLHIRKHRGSDGAVIALQRDDSRS